MEEECCYHPKCVTVRMAYGRARGAENRTIRAGLTLIGSGQPGRLALGKSGIDAHIEELCYRVLHICVDHTDFLNGALLVAVHHDGVVPGDPDDAACLHP